MQIDITKFVRMYKTNIKCPLCGHGDWCCIHPDGKQVICPRTPSDRQLGEWGFYHSGYEREPVKFNYDRKAYSGKRLFDPHGVTYFEEAEKDVEKYLILREYATVLGVHLSTLRAFNCGVQYRNLAIPMYDSDAVTIIGIQLRHRDAKKHVIPGSQLGVFLPAEQARQLTTCHDRRLVVTEGFSDAACAYELLGKWCRVFGKANNMLGGEKLGEYLMYTGITDVWFIGDRDVAGGRGIQKSINDLRKRLATIRIMYPPKGFKDLRKWFNDVSFNKEDFYNRFKQAQLVGV
jgi:hypothetical protein